MLHVRNGSQSVMEMIYVQYKTWLISLSSSMSLFSGSPLFSTWTLKDDLKKKQTLKGLVSCTNKLKNKSAVV